MALTFATYVKPGPYVQTVTETNAANLVSGLRIPVVIGVGQEELTQTNLEMIRGSSAGLDEKIISEDTAGRFVVSEVNPANPALGPADGTVAKFRVRNFPIVDGAGVGRVTNDVRSVAVTINGLQVAVGSVQGADGYVTLQVPPQPGDDVRVSYNFRRTDTSFTDDVSDQVTSTPAELTTPAVAPFVVAAETNSLVLIVDGTSSTLTIPVGSLTAAALKTAIDSQLVSGLSTAVFTDNEGKDHLTFTAAKELQIGSGTVNGILGFTVGNKTNRVKAFRVFQRPIVDGSDGGVTTTDTSKVVVFVDGVQQVPAAVDGTNGLVTLAYPPPPASEVLVRYWANTWQDTFDHLPNTLVTNVVRCGFAPSRNDFIEGQDFVIENPRADISVIHWGTSTSVAAGTTTAGATAFDSSQVIPTLVDNKMYLAPTTRYVNSSVVPAVSSLSEFILPEVPTTGNGRDTALGQTLYNAVANNRVSLPSNRPDLIQAWAGTDVVDALSRSPLTIKEVDSKTLRFKVAEEVPQDRTVYATFNYSRATDDTYTLTNKVAGAVGVGEFELRSALQGRNLHQIRFGTKTGLSQTVQWPRGSESVPDAFHSGSGTPVSETVTVTFGNTLATNATFTTTKAEPYDLFTNTSDQFRVTLDGSAATVDLDLARPGYLVSSRIKVNGSDQVTITTGVNDQFNFTIDGTNIAATLTAGTRTITQIVTEINAAIDATNASGSGGINFTTTAPNDLANFIRVGGAAGGDHVILISGLNTPSVLPAGFDESYYVAVRQGTAEGTLGFTTFQRSDGTSRATNKPATLVGSIAGNFAIVSGVNDGLAIQVDGVDYTVTLTAGAARTPAQVVTDINAVISGVASVGTASNLNRIRLTSTTANTSSRLLIKTGTANATLGFTTGDEASQTRVKAQEIANAIVGTVVTFAATPFSATAEGWASVKTINNQNYLHIEAADTGTGSTIVFVAGTASAFNTTTGLGIVPGVSGDSGEAARNNFVVTSSNASGSAGTGYPGQTYTDARTGLRFSILPASTGTYTATGSFTLLISETWKVNPSIPYMSVPGLELVVTDTVGVGVNDTSLLKTFNPGGLEPAIGDSYYVSYRYRKTDFNTPRLFAQIKLIEANYGPVSPENRVSLAAFLMIANGAVVVGIQQVAKEPGRNQATDTSYIQALKDLEKPLPGSIKPDVIVPLATSSVVYSQLMQHCEVMSTPRNQSERMGYIGFASGASPTTAQTTARSLASSRIVAVYPDSGVITLTDETGTSYESLVDGTFLAAAVVGSSVSPAFDVATPYTRRRIQGLTRIPRIMDPVEANLTAMSGVTILEDLNPLVMIRQGLTTDMSNVLTRLPTVIQIADYVQQSARTTLDVFIGTKFLASRVNDVEISLTAMFQGLVQAEIIGAYAQISAAVDPEDPTVLNVEASYAPVFPLLYIIVTFALRSRL